MLCKNCGKSSESTRFCIYCGADMTQQPEVQIISAPPVMNVQPTVMNAPPAMNAPPPIIYTQPAVVYEHPVAKRKRKTGLIIGIIGIIAALLIGAAAVMFFTMTYPVEGQWYNEERGEVLVFGEDGELDVISYLNNQNESFSFDRLKGEGSFSIEDTPYEFIADEEQMTIKDLGTYSKADDHFDSDSFLEKYGKLDTWYSEERGEVLVFSPEGALAHTYLTGAQDTSYEYDLKDSSGLLMLGSTSYDFSVKDEKLDIADIGIFTKADSDFNSNEFINEHGKLGTWYCEERGEVLVFNMDGTMESQHSRTTNDAAFEYDREDNTVKITIGPFSYDGEIKDGELIVGDMGTFVQAGVSFDTDAFFSDFGDSVLGIWYDPAGEMAIDLRDDGTYFAISYGTNFNGTYTQQPSGADINFEFLDIEVEEEYSIVNGELVKDESSLYGPANTMVRTKSKQMDEDSQSDDVIGTWVADDGSVGLRFIGDDQFVIDVGDEYTGTYEYDPLGDVGFVYLLGEKILFVANGDNLVLGELFFYRY